MSTKKAVWLVKTGLIVGTVFAVFCLSRAIPLGMAGSSERTKWFTLFFVSIIISIVLALVYYIQQGRSGIRSQEQIGLEALASIGKQIAKDKTKAEHRDIQTK